jgi:hypothetical protein
LIIRGRPPAFPAVLAAAFLSAHLAFIAAAMRARVAALILRLPLGATARGVAARAGSAGAPSTRASSRSRASILSRSAAAWWSCCADR